MLGYAPFPLKPKADAVVRSCLITSLRRENCSVHNASSRLQSGGRFEDASPLPFQNRFSLLIFRLLLPYSRLSSFTHPLSHPPYPTCRIGHTPPLRPKNTNAPLAISRPGTNQYVRPVCQKASESMLYPPSGRLADLLHLKAQ